MCHGGVFERALVPERSHTHMCAARGLCELAWFRVYRAWGATQHPHPPYE